jgi:xylulokinase
MAAMQNAGLALEWVRSLLGVDWGQLYAEAFSVPAGAQGARFLPYLSGERSPFYDPSARGCWAGLGLHHRRAHLLRAALEGVAFGVRDCVEALVDAGVAVPALRLAGGGSVDPRWRRLLADVLGRPLFAVEDVAASARGAALLAGVAAGRDPGGAAAATPVHAPLLVAEPTAAAARYAELYAEQRALSALLRARPVPVQP